MAGQASRYSSFADTRLTPVCALALVVAIMLAPHWATGQDKPPDTQSAQAPVAAPAFTDEDATFVLDNLQAALQSYNRKKFLAQFDSAKMPNFSAFQTGIKGLFDRYESFTVTYHLTESAVQNGNGVALADFGLDGSASSEYGTDLRRHTQLRVVVAWNGKQWKIVDLIPRAVFQ
jgi:hypothetical protein